MAGSNEPLTPRWRRADGLLSLDPVTVVSLSFTLYSAAQFFINKDNIFDFLFYITAIPALAFYMLKRRPMFLLNHTTVMLFIFFVYMAVSSLWGTDDSLFEITRHFRHLFVTVTFVLCAIVFSAQNNKTFRKYLDILISAALVGACLSIVVHFVWTRADERLQALGQLDQPVLGALVFGLFGLLAFFHLQSARNGRFRWVYVATIVAVSALMLLTQSRGPIAAFALTLLLGLTLRADWKGLVAAALVGISLIAAYEATHDKSLYVALTQRGASYRLDAWIHAVEQIEVRPILGHGLSADFAARVTDDYAIVHPHSLFLGVAYYGGFLGLFLLIAVLALVARQVWQARNTPEGPMLTCLYVYSLLAVLTDSNRPVTAPAEIWYFFWFPIATIVGHSMRSRLNSGVETTEPSGASPCVHVRRDSIGTSRGTSATDSPQMTSKRAVPTE